MLADVLHHAVRHQIPDRLVVFGAAAYIGRRDGQGRDLKRIDLSFGQGHAVRTGVAGARDGHEVASVKVAANTGVTAIVADITILNAHETVFLKHFFFILPPFLSLIHDLLRLDSFVLFF